MSGIVIVVLVFFGLAAGLGAVAFFTYQSKLRRAKAIERGLKMVPILIHLPPPSSDTQAGSRDLREVMREKTSQAEVLYNLIAGTATQGFSSTFYGQRHIALELVAITGVVHFFAAVPVALVNVVKQAIQTAYPGARMEEVEDHNIFNQEGRLAATLGGEMVLRAESAYPIATYAKLERDPMEALLTTIGALDKKDGVAVQVMLRPANPKWTGRSVKLANGKRKGRSQTLGFTAMDLAKAAVKSPDQWREEERARMGGGPDISNLQLAEIESIEEKTKHPGFEVLIRVIVSTGSVPRSQQLLRDIATAFALFETPGLNGFKFLPALDVQGLVTAFIFRFFPPELKSNVLNSVELATLFHLPDSQFTPSRSVERQQSKQVDGPVQLPTAGLLFGHNEFRGVKKEIRLSTEDRRRHTYILGQTGTGKSTMLENLAVQDMLSGNGFAFIDPHGDSAEKLLAMVPKERAEDIVYFNPADTEYPLGLNLFEFNDPSQKDFLVQETINMLYKLYDPGKTGIIGPRYEHWYRNAALTLMADPNGSTFIEIPKVFTDTEYLKSKFKYLRDPTVIDFWTKEMGQTSDYHKSEMLGWFVSKFGAFQNNEMMRNIIGQTKSAFNIRDIMDQKKILIVNLSKGRVGELNSQLLGMIFVIKFQAAAMSRADTPEDQRPDFALYVDEFQNFSTDSFASILSEARKYRLNLIVANQFIGQLSEEIRDAVFGNIGTIVAHRMGPDDAEFMVKQFAPVFDASDLVNIPNYNAAMRLMIGGLPSQPFTIRDSAPLGSPNLELGLAIKQLSAAKFGHTKAAVEADILERFSSKAAPAAPATEAISAPGAPAAPGAPGLAETETVAVAPVAAEPAVNPAPASPAAVAAPVAVPVAAPQVPVVAQAVTPAVEPVPDVQMPAAAAPVPATPTAPAYASVPAVTSLPDVAAMHHPVVHPSVAPLPQHQPVDPLVPFTHHASVAPPSPAAVAVSAGAVYQPAPVPTAAVELGPMQPVGNTEVANTAGQVMTDPPAIIPEDNPADTQLTPGVLSEEGGFGDLSAPIGAPAVPAPVVQPGIPGAALPGMAITPPPIGAPPVDVPPAHVPTASLPVTPPVLAPVTSPAAIPAPPVLPVGTAAPASALTAAPMISAPSAVSTIAVPPPAAAAIVSAPVAALVPEPVPGLVGVAVTPPPIGAPPVDLPIGPVVMPPVAPASAVAAPVATVPQVSPVVPVASSVVSPSPTIPAVLSVPAFASAPVEVAPAAPALPTAPVARPADPGTLNLTDITGGRPLPKVDPSSIPVMPPGTEPPLAVPPSGGGAVAKLTAAPAALLVPLGSGKPLEGDPYANIEVLGDLTPPVPVLASPPPAQSGTNAQLSPAPAPMMTGKPLPGDPYANVDILAVAPLPVAPGAQALTQSVAQPQAAVKPAPPVKVLAPMPEQKPEPVALPVPVPAPPVVPAPVMAPPTPAPTVFVPPAPVPEVPAFRRDPTVVTDAASGAPAATPLLATAPPAASVAPVALVAPSQPQTVPVSASVVTPVPAPAPASPPPAYQPEVSAPAAGGEPAASPADEPLIHFVDPAAEAVLKRLDVPDAMIAETEDSMFSGLPEGVKILEPEPVPPAAVPMPLAPAPVSPAPLPEPAPASATPQPEVSVPPVSLLGAPLTKMATTPPPIGAAPVDLGALPSLPPALSASPAEKLADTPKVPVSSPIPDLNATLAKALATAPAAPSPTAAPEAEEDLPARLASVADMLDSTKKPEEVTKPEGAVRPEASKQPEPPAQVQPQPVPPATASDTKATLGASGSLVQPAAKQPEVPRPQVSAVVQIEKAEHEIDDLLSTSLIHSDSSATHRRLPEPVETPREDDSNVDLEMNGGNSLPVNPAAPSGTPPHMAEHHGLKVIQPLEPIVPAREKFAREIAALNQAAVQTPPPVASAHGAKGGQPQPMPAPAPTPPSSQPLPVPKPAPVSQPPRPASTSAPVALAAPARAVQPVPESTQAPIVFKHSGDRLPEPAPAPVPDFDTGLPPAESLAANDVAKARAEREANLVMQKAQPAPPMAAPPAADKQPEQHQPAKAEEHSQIIKKKKPEKQGKPAERIESQEEAEHNKPTEAEQEQGALTGKLILPTGEKPRAEPVQPKTEKPKKLAPGEVFVDEHGNVVIGE